MPDIRESSFQQILSSPIHSFDNLIHEIYAIPQRTTSNGRKATSSDSQILSIAVEDLQKRSGIQSRETCEVLFMHGAIRFAHKFPDVTERTQNSQRFDSESYRSGHQWTNPSFCQPPYQWTNPSSSEPPYQWTNPSSSEPPYQWTYPSSCEPPYEWSNPSPCQSPYQWMNPSSAQPYQWTNVSSSQPTFLWMNQQNCRPIPAYYPTDRPTADARNNAPNFQEYDWCIRIDQ